jgi:predicted ribonuclease YlaK
VLVPIIVVDELDGLKQSSKNDVRARARQTLAILARLLSHGIGRGQLREADFTPLNNGGIPRGEVTVEILFDPPSHHRLPINDDEIIDRALAVQGLAGRPVTMITYDTGQTMRARAAGLDVLKMSQFGSASLTVNFAARSAAYRGMRASTSATKAAEKRTQRSRARASITRAWLRKLMPTDAILVMSFLFCCLRVRLPRPCATAFRT